jgi:hypothetical protein
MPDSGHSPTSASGADQKFGAHRAERPHLGIVFGSFRPEAAVRGPEIEAAKQPFTACGTLWATVINVRTLMTFLPSHEGGRTTAVRATYRALHNFGPPENREMWFGQIHLDADDKISPGESREVLVQFNSEPALLAELKPGRTWRVQEGPQLVATATAIEIVGET